LKFYASIRPRTCGRIETLKDGTRRRSANRHPLCKVVKEQDGTARFKQAEFDILYGKGASPRRARSSEHGCRSMAFGPQSPAPGSPLTRGEQLGPGAKENARNFLIENPDTAAEIEKKIKEKLGIGPPCLTNETPAMTKPCPFPVRTSESGDPHRARGPHRPPAKEQAGGRLCLRLASPQRAADPGPEWPLS